MLYPSSYGFNPLFPSLKDFQVIVKDDNNERKNSCASSC